MVRLIVITSTQKLTSRDSLPCTMPLFGHRSGRLKLLAERQVKKVRAQVELEYRSGARGDANEKKTEASVKALVETDPDVDMAEKIEIEAVYWYNFCSNYYNAMSQRMDLIKIIHKDLNQ